MASARSSFRRSAARDRAGDVRDVERVGQADPVVVALGRQEHLRLMLQPAERFGVRDAIAVPLEDRADRILGLDALASLGLRGERGAAESVSRSICSVRSRGLVIAIMLAPGGDRPALGRGRQAGGSSARRIPLGRREDDRCG
jgi:hypothetical protein